MKKLNLRSLLVLSVLTLLALPGISQKDTLHVYYKGFETKLPDTSDAKVGAWAKKLKGQHLDIEVICYYDKGDYKKYAQERTEDMFLILNRKARDFITITSNVTKKGERSQRSKVDVIYTVSLSEAEKKIKETEAKKAADEKALAEKTKKEEEKKKKEEAKAKEKQKDVADSKVKDPEHSKKEKTADTNDDKSSNVEAPKVDLSYGRPKKKPAGAGGWVSGKEVKQIKASRIIVAQVGYKELDDALFNAVKSFWTFTSDIDQMPYNKAIELAKKNDSILVLSQTQTESSSLPREYGNTGWQYKRISGGRMIMIENGKQKVLLGNAIPAVGDGGVLTEEILSFGVSVMNSAMIIMDKYNLNNGLNTKPKFKDHAGERIKTKTLLIPQELLAEKITDSIIGKIYPGTFKVVPYERYKQAILSKEKNMAYLMFCPMPVGGKMIYLQYIMDTEDGMTLGIYIPNGNSVDLGPVFGEKNISKGNTGEITEKCLKGYKEVYEGDW